MSRNSLAARAPLGRACIWIDFSATAAKAVGNAMATGYFVGPAWAQQD